MGVATVNFPQGLEFSNFFLRHYRPIRALIEAIGGEKPLL